MRREMRGEETKSLRLYLAGNCSPKKKPGGRMGLCSALMYGVTSKMQAWGGLRCGRGTGIRPLFETNGSELQGSDRGWIDELSSVKKGRRLSKFATQEC